MPTVWVTEMPSLSEGSRPSDGIKKVPFTVSLVVNGHLALVEEEKSCSSLFLFDYNKDGQLKIVFR